MPYFMLIGAVVAKFASGAETMFARLERPLELEERRGGRGQFRTRRKLIKHGFQFNRMFV